MPEEIWVTTTEAAEITGYDRKYLQKLASRNWKQPEDERSIRLRLRSNRYHMWLPDLIRYINEEGYGPYGKRGSREMS
jgi:hypothetical protein